ncbi:uncharacterized protein RMCC_0196 [Mycolicibacterium canariasense]|uniref:Uncharacterized protein n=1 Tax=Mycolicibacterium canariasense TaxID=228230 RepID=A0A124E1C9_MYCCR|nr:uncharacterized protein RMCC_0196 [Mycolicibacterium canariasense]CDO25751.1 hypothetical protein BN978_06266 [Mycolicibacterium mageritense DSM 44476 = CIP 104973]
MGALECPHSVALEAIAAITGQTIDSATEMFLAGRQPGASAIADTADLAAAVDRLCTRVGLAPALTQNERERLNTDLRALGQTAQQVSRADLDRWNQILRTTPDFVRTLEQDAVVLPDMPEHQMRMWHTLLDFEETDPPPWVLVGGQMTMLHLLEHGVTIHRPTDDGDMVVGVWTRRDALRDTTLYLTGNGFTEVKTSDGLGYRFARGKTVIDVMVPEGMERQRRPARTGSGRPGLGAEGGNQALTRAQRVPIESDGRRGYVRRPTLLGGLVAKAHAWTVDSRDPERHLQDLISLAGLALGDPRAVLSQLRPDDSRAMRVALRRVGADHRRIRAADDPAGVYAFLTRMANPAG